MATCDALSNVEDLTSCSICYEKFKTPRLLPCSHSFCHKCLCAHIVSSCEHKDVPLGFPCPLCRVFIPSPGQLDETTQWVEKFPINDVKQGNEPADIDERNIKYILTFHTVKEKMAEILKNAFNEIKVVVT